MKKFLIFIFILAVIIGGSFFFLRDKSAPTFPAPEQVDAIFIWDSEEINKENYTGSRPVIEGEDILAQAARTYIDSTILEFEANANSEVPAIKEQFGADWPPGSYTIDIGASQAENAETRSIILSIYVYTGGAHGSSSYKTFTASKINGKLLTLGDIIKKEKQTAFMGLVKEKLLAWRPELSDSTQVVFPEDVGNLSFEDLTNWSLNEKDMTLYFSQYEVGPGALGAFAFPIPLSEIADYGFNRGKLSE